MEKTDAQILKERFGSSKPLKGELECAFCKKPYSNHVGWRCYAQEQRTNVDDQGIRGILRHARELQTTYMAQVHRIKIENNNLSLQVTKEQNRRTRAEERLREEKLEVQELEEKLKKYEQNYKEW